MRALDEVLDELSRTEEDVCAALRDVERRRAGGSDVPDETETELRADRARLTAKHDAARQKALELAARVIKPLRWSLDGEPPADATERRSVLGLARTLEAKWTRRGRAQR